ncbi:MAG: hypothetical protein F9K29_00270 [Hyphomicrobiaceae bacterium]|nr:MAG: hypothetical protein F9K29_00270 [Hyphomicrobiaceae bacterium]
MSDAADPREEDPGDEAPFLVRVRTGEAVIAAMLLALAVAAGVLAGRLPLGTWRLPNAGFFPLVAAVGLAVSSAAVLVGAGLGGTRGGTAGVPIGHLQGAALLLGLLAVAWGFERLGFVVLWPVCVLLLVLLTRLGWLRSAAVAGAFVAGAYLVFATLLGLQLPAFVIF